MKRNFTIIQTVEGIDVKKNIIDMLPRDENANHITVYQSSKFKQQEGTSFIDYCTIPDDIVDKYSAIYNFIMKKNLENKQYDFIHIIDGSTLIKKDLTAFLSDIENMMTLFKMPNWFSTVCDRMNYIYAKYNQRFTFIIDKPELLTLGLSAINFTSHANTQWICYNMKYCTIENTMFDADYSIPMFYIIDFLARRKLMAEKTTLSYMNMYPSVPSEVGAFTIVDNYSPSYVPSQERMRKENEIFAKKNVPHNPDTLIDSAIETVYEVLMNAKKELEENHGN